MNLSIKCERTHCYCDAAYIVEERHRQENGTTDAERRSSCELHSRQELPQNLTVLSAWQILQWPDSRCDA
jgi:hypothetical protein